MNKREEGKRPEAENRINQFIIECLFNKYFEENSQEVVVKQEEIACPPCI
jgi:hypothetical protein